MPSVRTKLECSKPMLKNLRGILFTGGAYRPVAVNVPTAIHPSRDCLAVPRFPCFETILGAALEVHEVWVSCEDGLGEVHRFLIAAHYDPTRMINRALKGLVPQVDWRGDLLVMRGGKTCFVVNMGDAMYHDLAEKAVREFLHRAVPLVLDALQNQAPIILPTEI